MGHMDDDGQAVTLLATKEKVETWHRILDDMLIVCEEGLPPEDYDEARYLLEELKEAKA